MKVSDACGHDFFLAVVRAGRAFVAAKGKDPETEALALAEYLRSDKPIGISEREMLADLVLGHWRDRPGQKPLTAGDDTVVRVVREVRALASRGVKKESAKVAVAKDFGLSRSTVERYESMVIERERIVEQAKRNLRPRDNTF